MLTPEARARNLESIARAAVFSEVRTSCPAEVSAAQCILESGWLEVAPGNNCFGIKNTDRFPGSQYVLTKEYLNGEWIRTPLEFETYPRLEDCFEDHARLITGGFNPARPNVYAPAFRAYLLSRDLEAFVRGIARHYATDPGYPDKLIAIYNQVAVRDALERARRSWSAA
jgi:flagellum-specific peptidoglycan hydrolase FlgJ